MNNIVRIHASCRDSDTRPWNSLININTKPNNIIKKSIGTVIKIKNKRYVLACFHGIENYKIIKLLQRTKLGHLYKVVACPTTLIAYSDELDLALLDGNNLNSNYHGMEFDNILSQNMTLNVSSSVTSNMRKSTINSPTNIMIKYLKVKPHSKGNFLINENKLELIFLENEVNILNSFNSPKLPIIKCSIPEMKHKHVRVIKGLSGSLVSSHETNKLGMLLRFMTNDNTLWILDWEVINHFVSEVIQNDKWNGLYGICSDIIPCSIQLENGESKYAVKLENVNNNSMKNNDVIYSIDGKGFDYDGNVVLNNEDNMINAVYPGDVDGIVKTKESITINLNTYIATNYGRTNGIIKMNIMRKTNDTYIEKYIKCNPEPIKKYRKIKLTHDEKYIEVNGLIFTELSENIINFYRNHGFKLIGKAIEEFVRIKYSKTKTVVLINTDRSKMSKNSINNLKKFNIPNVVDYANKMYFCVVEGINKSKVKSLADLRKKLSFENNLFKIILDDKIKIKIRTTKNEICVSL
jgi:hypothetical protein